MRTRLVCAARSHSFASLIRDSLRLAIAVVLLGGIPGGWACAFGLHIVPDKPRDPHFTSGPCPEIKPPDNAPCPNGAATCPAFYNPALLPSAYNSVSFCASVPAQAFGTSGFTLLTMPLNEAEQEAFLKSAHKVESYVKDNVTVTVEVYKVAYLWSGNVQNYLFFLGNEYWNPVCGADALLPPFSNTQPAILSSSTGSAYYDMPETYTPVLAALKRKNSFNNHRQALIDALPSQSQINVEWPDYFFGWPASTGLEAYNLRNYLAGTPVYVPIPANARPFTLCGSPATMKMLGLSPFFRKNGHTIDDLNAPQYNLNVTLPGTDGAVVIPDLTNYPPPSVPAYTWDYDSTSPSIVSTQLPKAYFENSANFKLARLSCDDPSACTFPAGFNSGVDLIGVFNHELNHVLAIMQSQYYKAPGDGTALAYTYGTALFLLDLFDLDSNDVASGYGGNLLTTQESFCSARRNNNTFPPPTTIHSASSVSSLTPFVQFGLHDHLMVYELIDRTPQYFPLMNQSVGNPDGDINYQYGFVTNPQTGYRSVVFQDPQLADLPDMNVPYANVQSANLYGMTDVDTIREYSELAAQGWNIEFSTLRSVSDTVSPLARWYRTCFDSNGVFTTRNNSHCKFSVLTKDLDFLE